MPPPAVRDAVAPMLGFPTAMATAPHSESGFSIAGMTSKLPWPGATSTGTATGIGPAIATPGPDDPGAGLVPSTQTQTPMHWYDNSWVSSCTVLLFIYSAMSFVGVGYLVFCYFSRPSPRNRGSSVRYVVRTHDHDDDDAESWPASGDRSNHISGERLSIEYLTHEEEVLAWRHYESNRIGQGLVRLGMI